MATTIHPRPDTDNRFKFELKSGSDKKRLVLLIARNKAFNSFRFVYSTGEKLADLTKLPKSLKDLRNKAEAAYADLLSRGIAVNNQTLKDHIDLFRRRYQWREKELHIVTQAGNVEIYHVGEGVSRKEVEEVINAELVKASPNFKKAIDSVLSAGKNELFGFWQGILDGKIRPRHGKELRKSTLSTKTQSFNLVKEYETTIQGVLSFDRMDMAFYNGFTSWLLKKGFDSNTIGKHIKELKSILHLAYSNEVLKNDRFKYWPVTKEKNEVVTLSKEEVLKIAAVKDAKGNELSGTKADVRDIFVLACFLGPRISDFKSFTHENLSTAGGITFFEYVQEKTGARVKLPVHPIAQEILNKRGGKFPKMIAEQNFRSYLKDICKLALIVEEDADRDKLQNTVIIKIRDGKAERGLKYDVLSPHSARRTFASSLFYGWFGRPMPASLAMRYTGHKTEKSFLLYIGANEKDLDAKALEYFDVKPEMKIA